MKRICVLDRTKEPGANGDPLYLDVVKTFCTASPATAPIVIGGRYGLSSKDTTPAQMLAVFENLKANEPKNQFTVGIVDDVTFTLAACRRGDCSSQNQVRSRRRFFGLGADGTVGANKNSIKIIGGTTDKYCQAYFSYDSKKSGGYTSSHLRFGDKPITFALPGHYPRLRSLPRTFVRRQVRRAERAEERRFVPAEQRSRRRDDQGARCPTTMKKYLAENKINFYIINATKIAIGARTGQPHEHDHADAPSSRSRTSFRSTRPSRR